MFSPIASCLPHAHECTASSPRRHQWCRMYMGGGRPAHLNSTILILRIYQTGSSCLCSMPIRPILNKYTELYRIAPKVNGPPKSLDTCVWFFANWGKCESMTATPTFRARNTLWLRSLSGRRQLPIRGLLAFDGEPGRKLRFGRCYSGGWIPVMTELDADEDKRTASAAG